MKKILVSFLLIEALSVSHLAYANIYMGAGASAGDAAMQDYSTPSAGIGGFTNANPPPPAAAINPQVNCYESMVSGKGPTAPINCPPMPTGYERPVRYHVTTGSLKANVERIVAQSHWGKVVWNVPNDYRWVGNVTITASSIQDAMAQYLAPYPVQAIFYTTNRIVDIVPRREA